MAKNMDLGGKDLMKETAKIVSPVLPKPELKEIPDLKEPGRKPAVNEYKIEQDAKEAAAKFQRGLCKGGIKVVNKEEEGGEK